MLTLFEYLRRRAFDAVIDGTQDALEFLESPKSLDQTEATEDPHARRPGLSSQQNSSKEEIADSDAGAANKNRGSQPSEHLPPPRRRGRPRKNEQSKS